MTRNTEHVASSYCNQLMEKENVIGVAGGQDRVLVLVTEKKDLSELNEIDVVPRTLEGEYTDVIEVGNVRALGVGSSIGLDYGGTGTLGGIVEDEQRIYALTNNHVAAASNFAKVLSDIHSPGPADGLGDIIGHLARFEPIWFNQSNYLDAALIAVDKKDVEDALGFFPRNTLTPVSGWTVQKRGRTSGHTWGEVLGRNVTVNVDFGEQGVATFEDQLITTPMLEPGDSGSVLASRNGFPCALGFAGSESISIHTPISIVLRILGVSFC